MAFFKKTRDLLKANAMVSHLEFAVQRFNPRHGADLAKRHLTGAQKGLLNLRQANGEYVLTTKGWIYVIKLCSDLTALAQQNGFEQMARDCDNITEYAMRMMAHKNELVPCAPNTWA